MKIIEAFNGLTKKSKIIVCVIIGILLLGCIGGCMNVGDTDDTDVSSNNTTVEETAPPSDVVVSEKTEEQKATEAAAGKYYFTYGIVDGESYNAEILSAYVGYDYTEDYIEIKEDGLIDAKISGEVITNLYYTFENNYTEIEIGVLGDEYKISIDIEEGIISVEIDDVVLVYER